MAHVNLLSTQVPSPLVPAYFGRNLELRDLTLGHLLAQDKVEHALLVSVYVHADWLARQTVQSDWLGARCVSICWWPAASTDQKPRLKVWGIWLLWSQACGFRESHSQVHQLCSPEKRQIHIQHYTYLLYWFLKRLLREKNIPFTCNSWLVSSLVSPKIASQEPEAAAPRGWQYNHKWDYFLGTLVTCAYVLPLPGKMIR